jgi:hypothetical protein
VKQLTNLLDSNSKVLIENVTLHPWADNPRTIGSLAASQIGIFASEKDTTSDPSFFKDVITNGTLDKLISFLISVERDKFEAAILALSFLSEDNP